MQSAFDFTAAAARRDIGIGRAVDHADRDVPLWSDRALDFLKGFASQRREFLAEDMRFAAQSAGVPAPPDGRAWGGVMRRAARAGLICKNGFENAASSNLSPKVFWKSLVFTG